MQILRQDTMSIAQALYIITRYIHTLSISLCGVKFILQVRRGLPSNLYLLLTPKHFLEPSVHSIFLVMSISHQNTSPYSLYYITIHPYPIFFMCTTILKKVISTTLIPDKSLALAVHVSLIFLSPILVTLSSPISFRVK